MVGIMTVKRRVERLEHKIHLNSTLVDIHH